MESPIEGGAADPEHVAALGHRQLPLLVHPLRLEGLVRGHR